MWTKIRAVVLTSVACFLCIATANASDRVRPSGGEFQVNIHTIGGQRQPTVALKTSGGGVILWDGPSPDPSVRGHRLFRRAFDARAVLAESEFLVTPISATEMPSESGSHACETSDGSFVVSWTGFAPNDDLTHIFEQTYDSDFVPISGQFQVSDFAEAYQMRSRVSCGSDALIVWAECAGPVRGEEAVYGQSFDILGQELGPEFLIPETERDEAQALFPRVARLSDGTRLLTWSALAADGDDEAIVARVYGAEGETLGPEIVINTYTTRGQRAADVAALGDSSFVIAWASYGQDGDGAGIFAQVVDQAGQKLGGEIAVNTYTTGRQGRPYVAASGIGEFVVTWPSYLQDGSGYGVFARYFEEVGAVASQEFQVNEFTTGDQGGIPGIKIDVEMDTDGEEFLIVWEGRTDGFNSGILARTYCAPARSCGDVACTPVFDGMGDRSLTTSDALEVLRAAIGLTQCEPCICDTDSSGSVSALDALRVLRSAVDLDVSLSCPACS